MVFFKGLMKRFFGGESLMINEFVNKSQAPQNMVFTQSTPGSIKPLELTGGSMTLQPGAFIGSSPGIKLGVQWAGFVSWFAGMGLFKLAL